MSNKKEKIFINFVANFVLIFIIGIIFTVSFYSGDLAPISSGVENSVIYRGNTNNKNISLMINVYWGTKEVEKMLDILKQKNIKCTFFLGGSWVDDNNKTVKRIFDEGHELANHGYFHKDHKKIDYEKNKEEIIINEKIIEAISGYKTNLFAPPSGAYSKTTLKVCEELDYKVIMWSKDTIDWRDKDENLVFTRATKNLQNGDLILMHPMTHTVNALNKIINEILAKGFQVVTVSENIK